MSVRASKRRKIDGENAGKQILAGTGLISAAPLADSSHLATWNVDLQSFTADFVSLRSILHRDGYLFLKSFLPKEDVVACRLACIDFIRRLREMEPKSAESDILQVPAASEPPLRLLDKIQLQQEPNVKHVLEHDRIFKLMSGILSGDDHPPLLRPVSTVEYKWLRAVPTNQFTGLHTDRVYMGSAAPSMHTCWIPLGDIPANQGTLAILRGSNSDPELEEFRMKYGRSQVGSDGVQSGWLSEDPNDLKRILIDEYNFTDNGATDHLKDKWLCSDMEMGDVVVLHLDTLHISTSNTTNQLRLSADTRWLLADESCPFKVSDKRTN